jgi:hypothetical protein
MGTQFYGLSEAARLIGVSPASLKYQLLFGRVGDVALRAPNGSRLFTAEDVRRLRTLLNPGRGEGDSHDRKGHSNEQS